MDGDTAAMPAPPSPPSCSTTDLARRVGVSLQTVQRWVDAGLIRSWRTPGGHRRLDLASVEHFVQGLEGRDGKGPHRKEREAGQTASPPRVLIVDDMPLQLEVARMSVLHGVPDARILLADNGLEALIAVGRHRPDLIVTDIVMPHVDGFQMIRQLLASPERPPAIIAVSGQPAAELARRGTLPGSVPLLFKPYDPQRLAELARAALGRPAAMPLRQPLAGPRTSGL